MNNSISMSCMITGLIGLSMGAAALADEPAAAGKHAMHAAAAAAPAAKAAKTDEELIASAMSAAPKKLAEGAMIMAADAKGAMRTLRPGKNGFSCMPDNPETPGPDPMCWDKNAGGWVDAYMNHKTPPAGKVGLMYMLAGGTDASNTDPYAAKPSKSNHWIKTGPHIMIVGADASFYDAYPKNADPDTKVPYVMWAGSAYQHLMAPVK